MDGSGAPQSYPGDGQHDIRPADTASGISDFEIKCQYAKANCGVHGKTDCDLTYNSIIRLNQTFLLLKR